MTDKSYLRVAASDTPIHDSYSATQSFVTLCHKIYTSHVHEFHQHPNLSKAARSNAYKLILIDTYVFWNGS